MIHTADTINSIISCKLEFEVAILTPGGIPGVFDEHVVQASSLVMAVTDSEYTMVYWVNVLIVIKHFCVAIGSIDDTACV